MSNSILELITQFGGDLADPTIMAIFGFFCVVVLCKTIVSLANCLLNFWR